MVSSGLVNNIDVSHFRLSIHLITAFVILSLILWNLLCLKSFTLKKQNFNIYFSIVFIILIFIQIAYSRPNKYENNSISSLIKILNIKGFTIRNEFPPIKGSYGLYETKTKTIWISPITKKLGIYENVLIHEAVHAAQSCPKGFLTKLDVSLNLTTFQEELIKRKLVSNYNYENFLLEKEAFSIQVSPNALNILIKALNDRCL